MKRCIWCKQSDNEVPFEKKAHTIPKSLGGMNYNKNVCDICNSFFGYTLNGYTYSIEEALKETLCISRERLLNRESVKRKIGRFKSKFFDVKQRKEKLRLSIKRLYFFNSKYQRELCHNFKRGLIKMWFEEFSRQNQDINVYSEDFDYIRNFARYNNEDIPVFYFNRTIGVFLMKKSEAETPILIFNRSKMYLNKENYVEFEFLGHVFGFPINNYSQEDLKKNLIESMGLKKIFFTNCVEVKKITDIDFILNVMDK